eukprot:COSAG02_NODE_348_length_24081_cov_19.231007_1_plen_336_part_00
MLCVFVPTALAAGLNEPRSAHPRPDTMPNVVYTGPTLNSTPRNLSSVLAQTVSVLDYGATTDCLCKRNSFQRDRSGLGSVRSQPIPPFKEACCPTDSTAAFNQALESGGLNGIAVLVPSGSYRIDGTVLVRSGGLLFAAGATLIRSTLSTNTDPILRLDGTHSSVSGPGTLLMINAAPRGIVNIGPSNQSHAGNILFNTVADITLLGPGPSWRFSEPTKFRPELNGSSAVCIDSTPYELLCKDGPPHTPPLDCRDGATYYNLVRGITIAGVDVGVFIDTEVNANEIADVMMEEIGQSAYKLQGPLSENVISGGFVSGHGGNVSCVTLTNLPANAP